MTAEHQVDSGRGRQEPTCCLALPDIAERGSRGRMLRHDDKADGSRSVFDNRPPCCTAWAVTAWLGSSSADRLR